jgi:hypothetical protein
MDPLIAAASRDRTAVRWFDLLVCSFRISHPPHRFQACEYLLSQELGDRRSALLSAAANNSSAVLSLLIPTLTVSLAEICDLAGNTALHTAARYALPESNVVCV